MKIKIILILLVATKMLSAQKDTPQVEIVDSTYEISNLKLSGLTYQSQNLSDSSLVDAWNKVITKSSAEMLLRLDQIKGLRSEYQNAKKDSSYAARQIIKIEKKGAAKTVTNSGLLGSIKGAFKNEQQLSKTAVSQLKIWCKDLDITYVDRDQAAADIWKLEEE